MPTPSPHDVVILDFETTGLSPRLGDRAIEIGAVRLRDSQPVERFQSLMQPGQRISSFIEQYTGITNAMLADAPPAATVMADFAAFCGEDPLVAHNASFDQRFLDAERALIGLAPASPFACTLLLARRLLPDAPDHKLGTLVRHLGIPAAGAAHRALADAEVTAGLWNRLVDTAAARCPLGDLSFAQLHQLGRKPKAQSLRWLAALR